MYHRNRLILVSVHQVRRLFDWRVLMHGNRTSGHGIGDVPIVQLTRRPCSRVNCIAPGPWDRGLPGCATKQDPAAAKKAYDAVAARVGMGRWGKVEEIAYPVHLPGLRRVVVHDGRNHRDRRRSPAPGRRGLTNNARAARTRGALRRGQSRSEIGAVAPVGIRSKWSA